MQHIILADIFGETHALQQFAATLTGTAHIISPYDQMIDFQDEQAAYQHFTEQVGLDQYCEKISQYLINHPQPTQCIAFSIGASAIWKLSASPLNSPVIKQISGALCFYSSQIRHFCDLQNNFPIQIVFAKHEAQYSVAQIIQQLSHNHQLKIHHCDYLHGFMNPKSNNFNANAYQKYLAAILQAEQSGACHLADFDHLIIG